MGEEKSETNGEQASEMQHLKQSSSFHYTPAEIHHLPSHGGRETECETDGGDRERDRGRASEMQHLQRSSSFHYTPAESHHLHSHVGRETKSETEGARQGGRQQESETDEEDKGRDRGRARAMQHLKQSSSFHYTPAESHYLPSHGGREKENRDRGRAGEMQHLQQSSSFHCTPAQIHHLPWQGREEDRERQAANNLGHSIALLPNSIIILLLTEGGRETESERGAWREGDKRARHKESERHAASAMI